MCLLLVYDDEEEVSYTGRIGWSFFLVSFLLLSRSGGTTEQVRDYIVHW